MSASATRRRFLTGALAAAAGTAMGASREERALAARRATAPAATPSTPTAAAGASAKAGAFPTGTLGDRTVSRIILEIEMSIEIRIPYLRECQRQV